MVQLRARSPFMMKLVDFVLLSRSDRIVMLDSDVLFFRPAVELRALAERRSLEAPVFQQDPKSTYNLTEEQALERFRITMPRRVNTGIGVLDRSMIDLDLCEHLLADPAVGRPTGWVEQTLYALCAGAHGSVTFLSSDYLVSLERGLDCSSLTARHFAGPSRPLLTHEGMLHVLGQRVLG
jgi:hypothetical protein